MMKYNIKTERGASITTILFFLLVLMFSVVFLLKLSPLYKNYLVLDDIVQTKLVEDVKMKDASPAKIKSVLSRATSFQNIDFKIDKDTVIVDRNAKGDVTVKFDYQQQKPMFWQFDAVLRYDKKVTVGVGPEED